jgi:hypothetical protein
MRNYLIVICILGLVAHEFALGADCPDSSWIKYKDTKCFKLLKTYANWSEAKVACSSSSSLASASLARISSEDEQAFLKHYLFNTSEAINNIWIGASRVDAKNFVWVDGKAMNGYKNWGPGSPTEVVGRDCVQIQSGWTKADETQGTWKDVNCMAGNWAVCETFQVWTPYETQLAIIALRENPVPIGFIYTQLPSQPEPKTVWPQVQWQEVTSSYAGLFFRAQGSGSAAFGTPQGDSTRQISRIEYTRRNSEDNLPLGMDLPATGWSGWMRSAYDDTGDGGFYWYQSHRYHHTNVEVRPKNTAVRIWKRSG